MLFQISCKSFEAVQAMGHCGHGERGNEYDDAYLPIPYDYPNPVIGSQTYRFENAANPVRSERSRSASISQANNPMIAWEGVTRQPYRMEGSARAGREAERVEVKPVRDEGETRGEV